MNKSFYCIGVFVSIVLFSLAGCTNQVALTGKVTYTDGSPVQIGEVSFSDGQFVFRGKINPDGSYKLGGIKDGDGIRPGTYGVSLIDTLTVDEKNNLVQHVADKYASPETSGLTVEVKGKMTFDFQVERP